MRTSEPLVAALRLLRPRMSRLLLAISFGIVSLGSALALAAVSAWLITRAWQMPPVLDLSIAAVAVRALAITCPRARATCSSSACAAQATNAAHSATQPTSHSTGRIEVASSPACGEVAGRLSDSMGSTGHLWIGGR